MQRFLIASLVVVVAAGSVARGGETVVRGGSWGDRPKRCTSSFRLHSPAWQKVTAVGFRVVIPVKEKR